MTSREDPLGRFGVGDGAESHEVRLLNVPVRLLAASRERFDELMREFSLLALSDDSRQAALPSRLLELIDVLGVQYARARARPDAVVDEAIAAGKDAVDIAYVVPAGVVQAADQLEALMSQADEFCADERLLTLPRSELVLRLSDWYLGEFRRQVAGEDPKPWDGPLDA